MSQKDFKKLISYLLKNYRVFSINAEGEQTAINEIFQPEEAKLTNRLPFYPWKNFFVPEKEVLFAFNNSSAEPRLLPPPLAKDEKRGKALLGINPADLQTINLYNAVFEKDPYYHTRRENNLIIGYGLETEMLDRTIRKISQNDLKHLEFDIFLIPEKNNYHVLVGSNKGEEILNKLKYLNYAKIKFLGHKYAPEWNKKMNLRREKLKNKHEPEIWEELGKVCIECGKCTIVCPTCFCFRIDDDSSSRNRCWDSCYYSEFSEVAGGHKFLNSASQKVHFWYYHKFARIPDEFNMMGCIGCHRCYEVCPVGIDIRKVMEEIETS